MDTFFHPMGETLPMMGLKGTKVKSGKGTDCTISKCYFLKVMSQKLLLLFIIIIVIYHSFQPH